MFWAMIPTRTTGHVNQSIKSVGKCQGTFKVVTVWGANILEKNKIHSSEPSFWHSHLSLITFLFLKLQLSGKGSSTVFSVDSLGQKLRVQKFPKKIFLKSIILPDDGLSFFFQSHRKYVKLLNFK